MDKRVIFAVAGSGKTSSIIDVIKEDSRCLILTYTDNNTSNIKNRIVRRFGSIPAGVRVFSYFSFLYSFCYKPLVDCHYKAKGINFDYPLPKKSQFSKKGSMPHYFDDGRRLFASRIAKLFIDKKIVPEIISRIELFFDLVCIDEVQDFAANDFNLMCALVGANVRIQLVGDFYQHTFDTSRDGNTLKNLHSCFDLYCGLLSKAGFYIDVNSLSHSYRCDFNVCHFVEEKLGIKIKSYHENNVEVRLIDDDEIDKIYSDDNIIKLFYQKCYSYSGYTDNWGNTKGLDHFNDVCVVLNKKTFLAFKSDQLISLPVSTKNKLYVACTRAKGNLYFIDEARLLKYKK